MTTRFSPRAWGVAAAVLLAVVVGGGAYAYWSGTGSGSTQTRAANPHPLVLSVGTPSAELYPGGDVSVSAIATNPNPYAAHIGSLALDPSLGTNGFGVDSQHTGCDLSTLAFVAQDNAGRGWTVPPRTGSTDGALPIDMNDALTMSASAADACQSAVVTIHLVAGA
jgi:hypothetical protein